MRGLFGILLLTCAAATQASELRELRLWEGPDSTRAVFDLDAESTYTVFTLTNPDRVVIDIVGTHRAPELKMDPVGKGLIKNVRTGPRDNGLRVVLDVAHPVSPKAFGLKATAEYGYRLIFDLYPAGGGGAQDAPAAAPTVAAMPAPMPVVADAKPALKEVLPKEANLKDAAAASPVAAREALPATLPPMRPSTEREEAAHVSPASAVTPAEEKREDRIAAAAAALPMPAAVAPPPAPPKSVVASIESPRAASPSATTREKPSVLAKPVVIAVDAGHGGEDPGAHGASGLLEKDVTLAIARRLAARINAQPGMKAVLTRDGDYYVDLRERTVKARNAQADLFVSIHANAYKDRDMSGTAVYVLSDHGATTEQSRWIANSENSADLVGGVSLHDKDQDLAAVLIDISQSATMDASFDLGGRLLESLGKVNELQKPVVQQAGFLVLKSPDIPSVLVETAFITNPREERLLGSADYQDKLADSICDGVRGYFARYRPQQQYASSQVSSRAEPLHQTAAKVPAHKPRRSGT